MRNSNIEIVRFISMMLIIMGHLIGFGIISNYKFDSLNIESLFLIIIKVLTGFGVNLFVFISGFYRIKLSIKLILKLYFYVVLYQLFLFCIGKFFFNIESNFVNTLFPFSHAKYWFIQSYFFLVLLSPILNVAIEYVNWKKVLIPMGLLVFYFGFIFKNPIDDSGFGYFNMTFVYCIAGYMSRIELKKTLFYSKFLILSFSMECIVVALHFFYNIPFADSYNNPLNIANAVFLFMIFESLPQYYNKIINYLASSVLSMYLIHESQFIRCMLSSYINEKYVNYGVYYAVLISFIIMIIIMIISIIVDQIRIVIQNRIFNHTFIKVK